MRIPLESHLHACSDCRDELDGLRYVWRALDAAPVIEPPADFRAIVWQRIEADAASKQRRRLPRLGLDWRSLFTRPALAWAAVFCLVILLSGAVIPGVYTPAKLWFPWNMFSSSTLAPSVQVTGKPTVVAESGANVLKLPVSNPGVRPANIHVSMTGMGAVPNQITLTVPAGFSGLMPVTTVTGIDVAKLHVQWAVAGP